ncbi:hypothetical protein [Thermomonospora cellulosilytica]|uniref:Uncharacterized protein n=1 Tax=Thermomonospora cellulosilytica TaxID=1411118 RepID=A0A7W3MVW2_9ACTN|nr:hypothetical protein [Thermomonospora cellulosilytica]MBA9002870.1 hypothetical protein [Thermomonospora cellulosilytica]
MNDLSMRLLELAQLPRAPLDPDGQGSGVQVPDPAPSAPPELSEPVNVIISWGKWGVLVCGVAGLLICAGQMAIGRKNRSSFAADGATGVPWVLGGLSLVATAASIVEMFVG